jgi:hypothetical protein
MRRRLATERNGNDKHYNHRPKQPSEVPRKLQYSTVYMCLIRGAQVLPRGQDFYSRSLTSGSVDDVLSLILTEYRTFVVRTVLAFGWCVDRIVDRVIHALLDRSQ